MRELVLRHPELLAALALPWALAFGLWLHRRRRADRLSGALLYPALPEASLAPSSARARWRPWVEGLRWLALALLLVAMARPQQVEHFSRTTAHGVEIVLALDTSGSMQGLDLDRDRPIETRRDRLAVAKSVAQSFIERRSSDPVGLVVFGEQAFTQCPLTLDHGILEELLDRVAVGMAGGDATALGAGLATAVKRLKDSAAKSRVVVLATDGRNNKPGAITPEQAAEIARALGVRVYTIGMGGREPAPFLERGPFGLRVTTRYDEAVDEETLQAIAKTTGGTYYRAVDSAALARIYDDIDRLEKTTLKTYHQVEVHEKFRWLALPALGLLLGELALLGTALRKLP
ncbi:MAG TPA: VWA domain-containing protein [Thermoanaerobaculia bacterium]|nr:VWA domain-containing protein [Thermoanaerobaculia bacterium]